MCRARWPLWKAFDDMCSHLLPGRVLCREQLLACTQVMFAKWDDVLAIREVPETARGQCPAGGLPYATAMFHYARTLALSAKAEGSLQKGFKEEGQRLKGLAESSMTLLRVRQSAA